MSASFVIEKNKALKNFTSWLVGGQAEYYSAPSTIEDFIKALSYADSHQLSVSLLGGGTNVLISDQGVSGLVIHTHKFTGINIISTEALLTLDCLSGTSKAEALKVFMKYRLEPAIFLAGLPGDVAGGVVMNAGVGHSVHPREFCEIVESIDVLKKNNFGQWDIKTYSRDEIQWSYRKSQNWQPGYISKVRLSWPNQPNDEVLKAVREGNKRRKDTQPLNQPSCGSVFKNPPSDHAGRLIEASGLKGFSIGGAQVSPKHANFVVNTGSATAQDIHQVILYVQKTVENKFKVKLSNEVVYLGHWDENVSK